MALKALERCRASVEAKYQLAKRMLSGRQYDRGNQSYQDFKMLIDLRNAIVHIKTLHVYEVTPTGVNPLTQLPRVINQLEARGVLADVSAVSDPPASWIERLQCLGSARWSCTSAENMIDSVIAAMADSRFRWFWRGQQRRYYDLSEPLVP